MNHFWQPYYEAIKIITLIFFSILNGFVINQKEYQFTLLHLIAEMWWLISMKSVQLEPVAS